MKLLPLCVGLGSILLMQSCPGGYCSHDSIKLPSTPLNLKILNSPYDDWNCGIPWEEYRPGMSFLFSSNRATKGKTFDLTPHFLMLKGDGNLTVTEDSLNAPSLSPIANRVNTSADELGPVFFSSSTYYDGEPWYGALVYSQGTGNDHDLRVLSQRNEPFDFMAGDSSFADSVSDRPLTRLNSPFDDGYLTFSTQTHRVLFHSNREGVYHIYQVVLPDTLDILTWLASDDTVATITRVDSLVGTDGEERCPSLHGDTLLFVSNRSGGLGGFDIYQSIWNGATWSRPTNLGAKVNSSSNEYRPVLLPFEEGKGIFFSSDRPGGLGGYDIYLVKAP